ncbi:hypothetical protein [Pseudobacillus badius]|uniref:hypothetical protein n=1 Tax=Bacillus badius TaxID=1455 RepID=UPI0024A1E8DC|nr:hypothetical protein [Bacillus badius]GLY11377.1 hypothetical protein Bbad01_25930 [Bacillus badius]
MLTELAIWYLRKKKKSVMIAFKIKDGAVQAINKDTFIYENEFEDVDYFLPNGQMYDIPHMKKFRIEEEE